MKYKTIPVLLILLLAAGAAVYSVLTGAERRRYLRDHQGRPKAGHRRARFPRRGRRAEGDEHLQ